jgi:hypothetical protein
VSFLKHFVDCYESLEGLDLVCEDRLPVRRVLEESGRKERAVEAYTLMPAQKAWEDLWSHVYTMQARTCLRLGEISSPFVAFFMLMASSWSVLDRGVACQ